MLKERTKIMTNNNCVVAVFKLHTEAEAAINELNKSGFDMKSSPSSGATITPMNMWSAITTLATA